MTSNLLLNTGFCSPELLRRPSPLMPSYIETDRLKLISLTNPWARHSRGPSLALSSRTLHGLLFNDSTCIFRIPSRYNSSIPSSLPERLNEVEIAEEEERKVSQLKKRVVFGVLIGVFTGGVVLAGGLVFTVALSAAVFVGAREYFELVRSNGIADGMTPPPRYLSRVCSVICTLMPILTLYLGQIDVSVTSAAFIVAMALLLQRGNPRFSQLSSTIFGLFYCGYLPSFWIKLRCSLTASALNSNQCFQNWPLILGGPSQWTVGLVATLISISSIIAADTYAFIGGKAFGRTPLTNISPKKTWEGVFAGLCGCVATTVLLSKILGWPASLPSAITFGLLNFFGSLFGDLIESMIKRDAGVKDSGSLIPGHGGILDRVDSYLFTGSLAYSFIKTFLPVYGV
ncbi:phosphatidate cytidylyltransferase 4, chloroplastic-like [Impatiens glandulifera]|uniref:phosphatidate cytidylyltransferase 4, chloroplastic-like n=1 Tax=Impatiens glandulifera TaxID=253017 RepID=UPI001FB15CAB|nr:phosphatidate cytidylyltransferase 4, chloroplastic-like [Impatiens glandulifera]